MGKKFATGATVATDAMGEKTIDIQVLLLLACGRCKWGTSPHD